MSEPLRTSSGLHALGLAAVREAVVGYLRDEQAAARCDLSDAQIETIAVRVMARCNDPLAGVHHAGIALGHAAAYIAMGRIPPAGPAACACPKCGASLLGAPPPAPDGPGDDAEVTRRITRPTREYGR